MPYSEEQRGSLSLRRGAAAAGISEPKKRKRFIARQGEEETGGKADYESMEMELARERNRQAVEGFTFPTTRRRNQQP